MIKHFCDCCEVELTDKNRCSGSPETSDRLGGRITAFKTHANIEFEVLTGLNKCWNNGDFCKYCVIDAVNSLDDRPRATA